MFRSANIEDTNPDVPGVRPEHQHGRCGLYGMCIGYTSDNPYSTKTMCSSKMKGKAGYCGLATPSWKVAPDFSD